MDDLIPEKRYRYTVEANADHDGNLRIDFPDGYVLIHRRAIEAGAVELLPDPLPTTPGSFAVDKRGEGWACARWGMWRHAVDGRLVDRAELERVYGPLRVVHDASAPF